MKRLFFLSSLVSVFFLYSHICNAQTCVGTGGTSSVAAGNFVGSGPLNFNSMSRSITAWSGRHNQTYTQISALYSDANGSPFMFKQFAEATITLNNDMEISNVKVNYDGYVGEIIAINKEGEQVVLDPRYYKRIVVDDGEDYAIFQRSNPEKEDKFYQVLYDKNGLVFYKDPLAKFHEPKRNGLIETPSRFSKQNNYYIVNGDDKPFAVNLKKNEVFEHFPEIELVAMEEIIKKKKYKMKKESDYLALFAQL